MTILHRLNSNSFIEGSILEHKIPRCYFQILHFIPRFKDYWKQWHNFKIGNGYPEKDHIRFLSFNKRNDCERFLNLIEGNFLERSRHGDGWSKINNDYSEIKMIEKFDMDLVKYHELIHCYNPNKIFKLIETQIKSFKTFDGSIVKYHELHESFRVIEYPLLNGEVGYFPDFGINRVFSSSSYFNFLTLDFTWPKNKRNILCLSSLDNALEFLKLIKTNSHPVGTVFNLSCPKSKSLY